MNHFKQLIILIAGGYLIAACTPQVPQDYADSDALPTIYPDYTNVTIPSMLQTK